MRGHLAKPQAAQCPRRPAFTLIELMVVIGIAIVLMGLVVAVYYRVGPRDKEAHGASQLQRYLMIGSSRAGRDRAPRGLRLVPNFDLQALNPAPVGPGNATIALPPGGLPPGRQIQAGERLLIFSQGGFERVDVTAVAGNQFNVVLQGTHPAPFRVIDSRVTTLRYIEQPDDHTYPSAIQLGTPTTGTPPTIPVTFTAPGINIQDGTIQAGDYLEIRDHDAVFRIVGPPTSVNSLNILANPYRPLPQNFATARYRIIRSPRPFVGDEDLKLPKDVIIDLGYSQVMPDATGQFDILFARSGEVILPRTTEGKIILWVRDVDLEPPPPYTAARPPPGDPRLITIHCRTGMISSHPVAPGNDPYLFTRDGRSSGT